jgi:16S rRNA (uracil1498-N3)-methyltransferase
MSAHRFFLSDVLGSSDGPVLLPLSAADQHHAVDVLRLRAGELVEVVEPEGGRVLEVRLTSAGENGLFGQILGEVLRSEAPRLVLFQGVPKGDKMDTIVRQAVEIGVSEIVPVLMQRTIVRLDTKKAHARGERWRRVARAAAEQSSRASIPAVSDPISTAEMMDLITGCDSVFVLWEAAPDAPGLGRALGEVRDDPDLRIGLVIGPEGGLAPSEMERLAGVGAVTTTLGASVLRTETAAVAAAAIAVHTLSGHGTSR